MESFRPQVGIVEDTHEAGHARRQSAREDDLGALGADEAEDHCPDLRWKGEQLTYRLAGLVRVMSCLLIASRVWRVAALVRARLLMRCCCLGLCRFTQLVVRSRCHIAFSPIMTGVLV